MEQIMTYTEPLKNDTLQGNYRLFKENDKWTFGRMVDLNENKNKIEKALEAGYKSLSKPAFRGEISLVKSDILSLNWNEKEILVDVKCDGTRETAGKVNNKGFLYTDPEGLKRKSANISTRFPFLIKELEDTLPNDTVLDGELIVLSKDKKEILHRTVTNSIINASTFDPKLISDYAILFAFDCLFYNGKDIRDFSLKERLDFLHNIKSTAHIWIEKTSKNIKESADGYICNGSDIKKIKTAWNKITNDKISKPKYMAEGIMLKTLDHKYEYPQNKGWMKIKEWYEVDCVVLGRYKVKGSIKTYNYELGIFIPDDYAEKLLKDNKAKKKIKKLDNKFVLYLAKSDNTNIKANINDCLRIAAEEVLSYETEDGTKYYSFYIGRPIENVFEKRGRSDTLEILERLSLLQPKRIPIEELARWKQESIIKSIEEKWQNLSKNEILNFNYINSEEGEINGEERKTKEKNSEISTTRILSLSSEEKRQTEEKVSDIKEREKTEKEKEEKEVSYDGNGRKKAHEEKEKEGEKEGKKEKGKEGESTIIIGKETWLHLKCPSCNSNLSFPSIILNREKNIHCPWCNHNFLIKREDDS
jgi:hypothetical protein